MWGSLTQHYGSALHLRMPCAHHNTNQYDTNTTMEGGGGQLLLDGVDAANHNSKTIRDYSQRAQWNPTRTLQGGRTVGPLLRAGRKGGAEVEEDKGRAGPRAAAGSADVEGEEAQRGRLCRPSPATAA